MGNLRRFVRWADAQGQTCLLFFDVSSGGLPGTGDATDIMHEITFVSSTVPQWWVEGEVQYNDPVPGWDGYPNVFDSVRLVFLRRGGGTMSIVVPAPRSSMFREDGVGKGYRILLCSSGVEERSAITGNDNLAGVRDLRAGFGRARGRSGYRRAR